jgi:hypothetical protein
MPAAVDANSLTSSDFRIVTPGSIQRGDRQRGGVAFLPRIGLEHGLK